MPNYRDGGPVPTAPNDPDAYFFEEGADQDGHSNCYGYAVNFPGNINPGGRCGNSTQIHGNQARSDIADFDKYCALDGVTPLGAAWPGNLPAGGGWLAALFTNAGDMHWSRLDSRGVWSDKMPRALPQRSTFQDKQFQPHQVTNYKDWMSTLVFAGYYWVDANVPKKKSKLGCIIM